MNIKFAIIRAALALCVSAGTLFSVGILKPDTTIPAKDTTSQIQEEVTSNIIEDENKVEEPSSEAPAPSKPTAPTPPASKPTAPTPPASKPTTPTPPASKPTTPTPPAIKPTTPPTNTTQFSEFQNRVLELVNIERSKAGLKPMTINQSLSTVATAKSKDMADNNYFSHTSPTYGSPFDMMKQFGITYRTAGENIAMGQTTPEQVMNGWMNSEGHRKNIMNSSFTQLGVGVARNSAGRLYWTQMFIG